MNELFQISHCKNAKEMWDTLQVTHEGTTKVKRTRMNTFEERETQKIGGLNCVLRF